MQGVIGRTLSCFSWNSEPCFYNEVHTVKIHIFAICLIDNRKIAIGC